MLRRKKKPADEPILVQRLQESRCRRIAVVGLHAGSGSRTVMQQLAFDCAREGVPLGVTRAQRSVPDEAATPPPLVLPEGVLVATATDLDQRNGSLVLLETTECETGRGPVGLYRVACKGAVSIHGPDDPDSIRETLDRLQRRSGGAALIDGGWERRGFAAPGVTDGIILTVGTGYSRTPEHSAAAVRYMIDTLSIAPCEGPASRAWEEAASSKSLVVIGPGGRRLGSLPSDVRDPVRGLLDLNGGGIEMVAVPEGLHDGLLAPLVRSALRCSLVVRDPTRFRAAPVYLKAWLKGRGRLQVVRSARLLAVTTNPINPTGLDADPAAFRELVSEAAGTLPVHDVVLEASGSKRKRRRRRTT